MTESILLKFICANQGSVRVGDLEANYGFYNVKEIISNRKKFVLSSSGGEQKVVAKTELRLCRAKECQGCNNLHLCKKFLLGSCQFSQTRRRCRFSHHLASDHNMRVLQEHGLEDLDKTELCTLLLQNDNSLLPPVCFDYNNSDGEFGLCQDGDDCKRLHICERYLLGTCYCPKAHDFYHLQPSKTLQDRGVPTPLMSFMKSLYFSKRALRICDNRSSKGSHQKQRVFSTTYIPTAAHYTDAQNTKQNRGAKKSSKAVKDKTDICLYFIKGHCKHGEKCPKVHNKLPYRWEVHQDQQWIALLDNEQIEKNYCHPQKTYSCGFQSVCFDTMTCGLNAVRRLSTASSVLHPNFILTTEWLWYWEDEFRNWNLYAAAAGAHRAASISSAELEQKYLNNDKDVVEFTAGSQKYSLSFQDMIQTNKNYGTERLVRRRPAFVSSADVETAKVRRPPSNFRAVPSHWDKTQIPETGYKRISLQKSSAEFKEIEDLFCDTMRGFDILQIERIQNKKLWGFYECQKNYMKKNNRGQDVTEKKLFHGTDSKHVDAICHDNFDWRICGTHGTAFGKGSYFARDAKYSHSYTGRSEVKSMFVSQVLVGDFTQGSSDYVRPPSKDGGDLYFYDSCVDDVYNPSIFVVFEKHQIYPEYQLQYKEASWSFLQQDYRAPSAPAPAPTPVSTHVRAVRIPVTSVPAPARPVPARIKSVPAPARPVPARVRSVPAPARPVPAHIKSVPAPARPVPARVRSVPAPASPVPSPVRSVPAPARPVPARVRPVPSPVGSVPAPARTVTSTYTPVSTYRRASSSSYKTNKKDSCVIL